MNNDVQNASIIVNTGKLVNENDIDVKCDCDPTKTLAINVTTDLTFKQIFLEVAKFIENNNSGDKRYIEYSKLYLNKNNDDDEKSHINEKDPHDEHDHTTTFNLSLTTRRQIANQLFDIGQERQCITDSLSTTAKRLFIPDHALMRENQEYQLNLNWFAKVYSFLAWQQDVVSVILHNLANLSKDEVEESEFVFKFDFFMSLHSYLDKLIKYLVFFYCCFDTQSWIAIFYPFIETAIGTKHCTLLFVQL